MDMLGRRAIGNGMVVFSNGDLARGFPSVVGTGLQTIGTRPGVSGTTSAVIGSSSRADIHALGISFTPPAASHRDKQLRGVLILLCLCANESEQRLLSLPLRIEKTDNARAPATIADSLKAYRMGGHLQGVMLCIEKCSIVLERFQQVGDLAEGHQYGLLTVGSGTRLRTQRPAQPERPSGLGPKPQSPWR